jgi:hypothetical protein
MCYCFVLESEHRRCWMREDESCRKEDVFIGPRVTSFDSKNALSF